MNVREVLLSHNDHAGFLPTFGPCFVHLYGAAAGTSHPLDVVTGSDELLEGNCYRGRLLISVQASNNSPNHNKHLVRRCLLTKMCCQHVAARLLLLSRVR